jgi:hypothetical protein
LFVIAAKAARRDIERNEGGRMSNGEMERGELVSFVDPLRDAATTAAPRSHTDVWLTLGVALYSLTVAILGKQLDEAAIGLALRLQGRLSFSFYVLALAGPGLHALNAPAASRWLAQNRDALYRAFALSQLVHGIWIVLYYGRTSAIFPRDITTFSDIGTLSGVPVFPIVALLVLPRGWRRGVHWARVELAVVAYVWVQFVGFFIDRLYAGRPELRPWYLIAIALCMAAAWLAWRGARRART